MRFFPLLSLAALAIGAAINRADPSSSVPPMTASYSVVPMPCTRRDAAGRCQGGKPKFARAAIDRAESGSVITAMRQVTPKAVMARSKETIELTKPMTETCQSGSTTTHGVELTSACASTWPTYPDPRSCAISYYAYLYCATSLSSVHRTHTCLHTDVAGRCQGWGVRFAEATTSNSYSPTRTNPSSSWTSSPVWSNTLPVDPVPTWTKTRSNIMITNSSSPTDIWQPKDQTSTTRPPWSNTLPINPVPTSTKTRSNILITNSPIPSYTGANSVARTFPTCSFDANNGEYICPTPTTGEALVPTCYFDPVKGEYVCPKPPTCYFDPVKDEYICPTSAVAVSGPVPTCYFDPAKGQYVCPKPPTCYFDPAKGEYVCPKAVDGKS
jgi:hypothetical protein